ncbi:F0F1 ATP synthase subunit B [Amycolatopsis pigmentata]|uniref:ATP synthase subunit b n=1 Tax=Amycolatopsis pigmentata TaxID=450801 RepID=A0ABW5G191_9PSEU
MMDVARYIGSLFAFALIIGLLWWKGAPPVRKMMRDRQETIRHQLEEAKRADERLAEAEKAYQNAIMEARTEAAVIRDAAREDAQRIVEEMRTRAEAEVERIKQRGEEHLVQQHQQLIRELRVRIGGLASELAGRLVREHLAAGDNRSATVDRFLDELEAVSARDGETVAAGSAAGKGGA